MLEGSGKRGRPAPLHTPGGTPPVEHAHTLYQWGHPSAGLGGSVSLLSAESSVYRALDASRNTLLGVLSTGNSPLSQGAAASRSESFLSSPDVSETGASIFPPVTIAPQVLGPKVSPSHSQSHRQYFHSRTASLPSVCSTEGVCSVSVASSTPFARNHHPGFPAPSSSGPHRAPRQRTSPENEISSPNNQPANISFCTVSMCANTCSGSEGGSEGDGVAVALDRALTNGNVTSNVSSDTLPLSHLVSNTASARYERAITTPGSTPTSNRTLTVGSNAGTPPREMMGSMEWLTGGYELETDTANPALPRQLTPQRSATPVRIAITESSEGGRPPRPRAQSRPSNSQHSFSRHQLEDPLGEAGSFPLTRSRSSPISMSGSCRLNRGGMPHNNSYDFVQEDSFFSFPRRSESGEGLDMSVGRANNNTSPHESMDAEGSTSFLRYSLPPLADHQNRMTTPVFGTPPGAYPNSLFLVKAIDEGRVNNYSIATQAARTRRMVPSGSQGSLVTTPMRPISPSVLGGSARMEWGNTPLRNASNRSTPSSACLNPPSHQQSTPVVANRTFAAILPPPMQHAPTPNYPPGGELRNVLAAAREALSSRARASSQVSKHSDCQTTDTNSTTDIEVAAIRWELAKLHTRQVELESKLAELAPTHTPTSTVHIINDIVSLPTPKHKRMLLLIQGVVALCGRLLLRSWLSASRGGVVLFQENPLQRCYTALSTWLNECEH